VSAPAFKLALRLRMVATGVTALSMASVSVMVGALFPSVGGSIGRLDLPEGVSDLLGGADYATIVGWMRSEIGAVYGPLVIAATAITSAVGLTAGEEEDGILGLTLAHPIERWRLILSTAAAVATAIGVVAAGTLAGLIAGVAVGGGGIALANLCALALHLALFGCAVGALALALAATTGRKAVASGGAAAFTLAGFLINGFAPLVDGLAWLKYLSPFYYYAGDDPIGHGVDLGSLAVLGAAAIVLTAIAAVQFQRRDLRN
jgi:ABC-2 type transport system permease protein